MAIHANGMRLRFVTEQGVRMLPSGELNARRRSARPIGAWLAFDSALGPRDFWILFNVAICRIWTDRLRHGLGAGPLDNSIAWFGFDFVPRWVSPSRVFRNWPVEQGRPGSGWSHRFQGCRAIDQQFDLGPMSPLELINDAYLCRYGRAMHVVAWDLVEH